MQKFSDFGLEVKYADSRLDMSDTDGALISGYASVFGKADQSGDRVRKGAFVASLGALNRAGRKVKMLWQHDAAQPIGVWEDIHEDDHGLYVKGRILTDVRAGREAISLLKAGAIDGLSIGYRVREATAQKAGGRELQLVDLWEVSLVTFPMLVDARVDGANGQKSDGEVGSLVEDMQNARALLHESLASLKNFRAIEYPEGERHDTKKRRYW